MNVKYSLKLKGLTLSLLMFWMIISQVAISASSVGPIQNVAIVFGDTQDPAINSAISTLKSELDRLKVVTYGSIEYYWLTSFKSMMNVIFVGHGSEHGISLGGSSYLDWESVANVATSLPLLGKVHFLNCNSASIDEVLPADIKGITFNSDVDATIGALLISLVVELTNGFESAGSLLDRLMLAITQVRLGIKAPQMLYHSYYYPPPSGPSFTLEELAMSIVSLVLTALVQALFLYAIPTILSKVGGKLISILKGKFKGSSTVATGIRAKFNSIKTTIENLFKWKWNYKDIIEVTALNAVELLKDSMGFVIDSFNAITSDLNWLDQIFLLASLIASFIGIIATGGTAIALGIIAAAWPMWKAFRNVMANAGDSNSYWSDSVYSCAWDVICEF